jgi:hypothetical protein
MYSVMQRDTKIASWFRQGKHTKITTTEIWIL